MAKKKTLLHTHVFLPLMEWKLTSFAPQLQQHYLYLAFLSVLCFLFCSCSFFQPLWKNKTKWKTELEGFIYRLVIFVMNYVSAVTVVLLWANRSKPTWVLSYSLYLSVKQASRSIKSYAWRFFYLLSLYFFAKNNRFRREKIEFTFKEDINMCIQSDEIKHSALQP